MITKIVDRRAILLKDVKPGQIAVEIGSLPENRGERRVFTVVFIPVMDSASRKCAKLEPRVIELSHLTNQYLDHIDMGTRVRLLEQGESIEIASEIPALIDRIPDAPENPVKLDPQPARKTEDAEPVLDRKAKVSK